MRKLIGALLVSVFVTGFAGCSTQTITVPREAIDLAARLERTLASDQFAEMTENLDEYLIAYAANYSVAPRRADHPLDIAEAYLRENQPGPLPRVFQTTVIYDRRGVQLAEVFDEGQRTWVGLDEISPHLIDAVIATEDASFYTNQGVDARRVVGAFVQNAEAGDIVSGASTITMQLARQLFFKPEDRFEQSMERKIYEALLAQELSEVYTKDELLEMYLNMVHFGRLAYGIEAASQTFFAKSASDLTLAEASLLAGTPQMPGGYDLLGDLAAVKDRQRVVLDLMVRHGYLTQIEADAVFAEEPEVNYAALNRRIVAPHFVNYVKDEMNARLQGIDIARSGLRVYTTLDSELQALGERIVAEQVETLEPIYDLSNASLVALKPGTSEILVMVGSADFNDLDIDGQVNVAIRQRQPGSAIKPILYATAIEDNLISPATVIWDMPVEYKLSEIDQYKPVNYDDQFHGPVTVRTALANSYNVPAVKLLDTVGIDRMLEKAREMGIESLKQDSSWYGLSLTLGGGEVTLLDLTEAFHTIANAGVHVRPQSILHVSGDLSDSYVISSNLPGERVLRESTAFLVTSMLSDNASRSIEFGENSPLRLSRPAAAKTGTTNDIRDNWTVGYTKYLVAGVWAGNSDGRPMRRASGITGAAPIWNAFMETILSDPELLDRLNMPQDETEWSFEQPESVQQEQVRCPAGLRCTETEFFSDEWITALENRSPLYDSVSGGALRTVYADFGRGNQPIGACTDADSGSSVLLRLPNGIGSALPWYGDTNQVRIDADKEYAKRITAERAQAVRWSSRNQRPLVIGSCSNAEQIVRWMYGDRVLSASVAEFTDAVAADPDSEENIDQEQDQSQLIAATMPPIAQGSDSYRLLGVAHDANCGGNAVMGQVTNGAGQPVGGVGVLFRDNAGTALTTLTGTQNPGLGAYRFSLGSDPQTVTITLVNASGQAISPTATVPHKQGGASDQGCHYVIWQGG